MSRPAQITPHALAELLRTAQPPALLDCREPEEVALCSLPHATHIPMQQIPQRLSELDDDRQTVVYCHLGMRSEMVAGFLREQGFARVLNLTGGIDAWSREVDPSVPRY